MMPPLPFGRRLEVRPPQSSAKAPPQVSAKEWWGRRRLRYNIGLIIAGMLAFAVQVRVVSWGRSIGALEGTADPDALLVAVILDGIGYISIMGLANVCYFLGRWSEGIIRPSNYDRYRKITFRLGFWFSVLLPFSIPAQLACFLSTHPSWRQFHG
jgi:hypothetical protein